MLPFAIDLKSINSMMMKAVASLLLIAATAVSGFQVSPPNVLATRAVAESSSRGPTTFQLASDTTSDSTTVSTAQEILDGFHSSNLPFRIVVIGNGAILETTSKLGRKCL